MASSSCRYTGFFLMSPHRPHATDIPWYSEFFPFWFLLLAHPKPIVGWEQGDESHVKKGHLQGHFC